MIKKRIITVILAVLLLNSAVLVVNAESKNVFWKNSSAVKKVALTFDDGPHPRYTHSILQILREYGVTATFFVIGINVENYPDTFLELAESDCEIGNHTYSHKNLSEMNAEEINLELTMTEQVISKYSDIKPTLFRPPQGAFSQRVEAVASSLGYDIILWSIDTMDWAHNPPDRILLDVIEGLDDGDIILMHDYVSQTNTTCEALRRIIPKMLELGYEFVTVSELIGEE